MSETNSDLNFVQKANWLISSNANLNSENDYNDRLNKVRNQVFGNTLILAHICCFLCSADLSSLRLVNHIFQKEATRRFQKNHQQIVLRSNFRIKKVLHCVQNRSKLKLTPFPFSGFEVDIHLSSLESLGLGIGKYIKRYSMWEDETTHLLPNYLATEGGDNAAVLLSYSPQLVELKLKSLIELCVSDQGLQRVPSQFRSLKVINGKWDSDRSTEDPLIDILVARAPYLINLELSWERKGLGLRISRKLAQNPKNICSSADWLRIEPNTDSFSHFQAIINLKIRFTAIYLIVDSLGRTFHEEPITRQAIHTMFRTVFDFLEINSNSLTDLDLWVNLNPPNDSLPLPVLGVLTNLSFRFPYLPIFSSRPIQTLSSNSFPVLQKLSLTDYRDVYGMFDMCSMASVKELHLIMFYHRVTLTDVNLNWSFPNLTSLYIRIHKRVSRFNGEHIPSTLGYVLSRLTRLVNLNLEFDSVYYADCWNILTGKTSGPPFNQNLQEIYPSLENMRALKTLRFSPCWTMILSAILCMSRDGRMVPLEKLTLFFRPIEYSRTDLSQFNSFKKMCLLNDQKELSKFHNEVVLDTDIIEKSFWD